MLSEGEAIPRVLHVQNRSTIERFHHSRPRDLHRIRLSTPGFEASDGSLAPLERGMPFDILLLGAVGHPLARPFPLQIEFNEAAMSRVPKRVLMLHDVHRASFRGGQPALRRFIQRWIHYVIFSYPCRATERLLEGCYGLLKTYQLGNHIDMEVFRDYGEERSIEVLLYGQTGGREYPFRRRLAQLLPRTRLVTRVIQAPRDGAGNSAPRNEELSRLINGSWLAIATPTRQNYFVAKYLEIAASRTVVAGKLPREERDAWRHSYVRLEESMSDEEIVRRLESALGNKRRLLEMADRVYGTIRSNYGYDAYARKFRAIMNDIYRSPIPA